MTPEKALCLILGISETKNKSFTNQDRDWARVRETCRAVLGVESLTADEGLTGPESSREEVAGISTNGQNSNFSNTGLGGGSPERVAPATLRVYLSKLRLAA